jgi:glycosyltransferase involved in cell wall biosynthesis
VAQLPHFVFSPSTLISAIGFMRGPDPTPATPAGDWRAVSVDVVIPAHNEQGNIVRCLASLVAQTRQPRTIVVVDDGSIDRTADLARAFGEFHGVNIRVVRRPVSIGKTPTIKELARTLDSDVLFVLDADTLLESPTYIERLVEELYQGVGIATACGSIQPLRERDRQAADESPAIRWFADAHPWFTPTPPKRWWRRLASGITNTYREVLYLFLQRVIFRGHMAMFGTVANPAGCAVAYRRAYLESLFDTVEPQLGDDLTNSEDIFIGLAMLNEGYRNIQVLDVLARTVEPEVQRLPRQLYLWSSAFLQSAFYFDALLKSPFKVRKRRRFGHGGRGSGPRVEPVAVPAGSMAYAGPAPAPVAGLFSAMTNVASGPPRIWAPAGRPAGFPAGERRRIQEPYRQPFGREHTRIYGRPAGWALMAASVEKIAFPTVMVLMLIFRNWEGIGITLGAETLIAVAALTTAMKGRRVEYAAKGIAVTPLRYAVLVFELVTISRFASDLWLTGNRRWRK